MVKIRRYIDNGTIITCAEFKYLGSYFTQEGKLDGNIRYRATLGKTSIQKLNSLLGSSKMNMKVKSMMYNSVVELITTYASECWTLTTSATKKLETVEMDFLRRACQISKLVRIRNDVMKERLNMETAITERIQQRQLIKDGQRDCTITVLRKQKTTRKAKTHMEARYSTSNGRKES